MEINIKLFFLFLITCLFFLSGCGWTIVKDSEIKKVIQEEKDKTWDSINLRVLAFSEEQSHEIISGNKPVCQEERELAKQFLADLKTVNDALPDDRKILDANGRLKDVSKLSSVEEQSMADIVFNTIGTAKRSPEVENAVLRLSQRMSATRQAFDLTKPIYQPR